jgi:ABC-type multidrug transport system permease subunit
LAFFALSLPFIAICAWISAAIDSPFASLTLSTVIIGLGGAFLKVFGTQLKSDWLNKTFPTGWKYELLSSDLGVTLIAHGALLLFTAFFLYVGLKKFQTRDL